MQTSRILMLAAILSATTAVPAFAQWDNIGSVDVDYNIDRSRVSPDFGGPVTRLQFTARGGDVQCRSITTTFANGNTRQIFSGRLAQGQARAVDLPGDARNVRHIQFTCHAFSKGGAKIQIGADIGQYRNDWMKGPQWAYWSRYFTDWQRAIDNSTSYWVQIGSVRFQGLNDRDNAFGGFAGRSITTLGFRPLDGAAICGRTTVTFGNGTKMNVVVNGGRPMAQGQMYRVDLPGNQRNVTNVVMRCHALGNYSVTINILGNK